LQEQVASARAHQLTSDQINTLISQVSVYPKTGPLVSELTDLMLDAAASRSADPNLPAYLKQRVALARALKLSSDQVNTLISQVSIYPGTGALVSELTQIMLEVSKPSARAAASSLPRDLQEQVEKARRLELTSDQINRLISEVSIYSGTGPLIGELAQLMLTVSGPRSALQTRDLAGFVDIVGTLISLAGSTAENTYTAVSTLVSDFIDTAVAATGGAVETVAAQFLSLLKPLKWLLGDLYNTIVGIVDGIVNRPDAARYLF
jgi:hypothetical protein